MMLDLSDIKMPNRFNKVYDLEKLNSECNYLIETLHNLVRFDDVIDAILKHIKSTNYAYDDFYSGYVYNTTECKCVEKSEGEYSIDEYPIWCRFNHDEYPWVHTSVFSKSDLEKDPIAIANKDADRITVYVTVKYLELYKNPDSANVYLDDEKMPEKVKELIRSILEQFKLHEPIYWLRGDIKHKFIHIFHSYWFKDKDLLAKRKNRTAEI